MRNREKIMVMKKHLNVRATQEFVKLFKSSPYFSCNLNMSLCCLSRRKGRSYILSSRTRKSRRQEMEEDGKDMKLIDLEKERDLLTAELVNIKNEIQMFEAIKIENIENMEKLANLYNEGVIDELRNLVEHQI